MCNDIYDELDKQKLLEGLKLIPNHFRDDLEGKILIEQPEDLDFDCPDLCYLLRVIDRSNNDITELTLDCVIDMCDHFDFVMFEVADAIETIYFPVIVQE